MDIKENATWIGKEMRLTEEDVGHFDPDPCELSMDCSCGWQAIADAQLAKALSAIVQCLRESEHIFDGMSMSPKTDFQRGAERAMELVADVLQKEIRCPYPT